MREKNNFENLERVAQEEFILNDIVGNRFYLNGY